jgi:hypothetical protein
MPQVPAITWPVLALFVIGALIRLLKSDKPILSPAALAKLPKFLRPLSTNKRLRPWTAIALGVVYAGIEKWRSGEPWKQAIIHAAVAGLGPIVVHEVGVESILGGKDPLTRSDAGGDAGGPPTKPSDGLVRIVPPSAILALCLALAGCGLFGGGGSTPTALDLKDPAAMRAVLASGAQGVLDAWNVCKTTARALGNVGADEHNTKTVQTAIDLAKQCESEYDHAREALLTGQSILDIYENAYEGRVSCAALTGFDGLKHLEALVSQFSKDALPKSVTDAEQNLQRLVAALVAPMCPVPMSTSTTVMDAGGSDVPILVDAAAEGG